jgi:hypothetical protein
MPVLTNQLATLTQEPTTLFVSRLGKCQLKVTGIAGEFTTIPMQTRKRGGLSVSPFFEATEVELSVGQTVPSGTILAKAPEGVGSLDIVYETRTRKDALGFHP